MSLKAGDRDIYITFISDNCCGQNKNNVMYLASLYMYAVTTIPNLKAITYKYLIKGHTQKAWGKAGKVRDALTGTGRGPSVPPMTEQENNVLMISCRAAMFGFTDQETSFVS